MESIGIIGGADGPTAVLVSSQIGDALIAVLIGIVVHIVFAFLFRNAARMKGHTERRYFWLCLVFGLPGWILVAALPDLSIAQNRENCKRE